MYNKTNPLSPVILSPCLRCIRINKKKITYTCEVCTARADFALASFGDAEALQRCITFDYPELGQHKEPPPVIIKPVKKRIKHKKEDENWYGRRPATEEHYESYFNTQGMAVNRKYNKKFKTMKEVLTWLYEKFKSQKYIAENELFISGFTVHCMLKRYNIKKLSSKKVGKLWYGKKKEGC